MASKSDTAGSAKAGKKKSQKKGAPFSGIAGAFDATMALGPLAGLARILWRWRRWPNCSMTATL